MMLSISRSMVPAYDPSPAQPPTMAASLPIMQRPLSQRPKLSINTQQPRILGKATSLRLDVLSAVSPTVRNTFSNAHEQPSTAPALQRPAKPQLSIDSSFSNSNCTNIPDSASTLSSTLTSASNESATISIPYKHPHHLTSILTNSPARLLSPRKMAPSRPMFPATKRVSFRTPLEEEITTVKYTLAHSDLESSVSTISSIGSSTSNESNDSDASEAYISSSSKSRATLSIPTMPFEVPRSELSSKDISPRPRSPQTGEKRDSSSSEDDSDCPETPVAGRRKRKRDWRWTLGPIAKTGDSTLSTGNSTTTSEDSS